jgi:hypothetical protein
MKFEYVIEEDQYAGIIITEFLDHKKNIVWELDFIVKNKANGLDYTNINRCFNWLKKNHPELLI